MAEWPSGRVAEWPSGLLFGSFLRDTSNLFRCCDLVLQDELNVLKIGIKDEMEQFPSLITNVKDLKRKKELENLISVYDEGEARFLVMRNPSDLFSHFSSVHDNGIVKIFRLSKVIWDCILLCSHWSRILTPLSEPITCKTKTSHDLVTRVFPRFRQFGCFYFEF